MAPGEDRPTSAKNQPLDPRASLATALCKSLGAAGFALDWEWEAVNHELIGVDPQWLE